MTLDELINRLQQAQTYCGDTDVVLIDVHTGWADDLDKVEIEELEGSIRIALFRENSAVSYWGTVNDPR